MMAFHVQGYCCNAYSTRFLLMSASHDGVVYGMLGFRDTGKVY